MLIYTFWGSGMWWDSGFFLIVLVCFLGFFYLEIERYLHFKQDLFSRLFSFYMILGGKISIYVLNKKSEEGDETVPLDQIGTLNEKGQLDRSKLGIFVTHLGKDRKST